MALYASMHYLVYKNNYITTYMHVYIIMYTYAVSRRYTSCINSVVVAVSHTHGARHDHNHADHKHYHSSDIQNDSNVPVPLHHTSVPSSLCVLCLKIKIMCVFLCVGYACICVGIRTHVSVDVEAMNSYITLPYFLTERAKKMAGMVQKSDNHEKHTQHRAVITMERMRKWSPVAVWLLTLVVV